MFTALLFKFYPIHECLLPFYLTQEVTSVLYGVVLRWARWFHFLNVHSFTFAEGLLALT